MKACLSILIGCLLCSYTAFADEVKAVTLPHVRIYLQVSIDKGDPALLEQSARSFLTREFKTIPDITLVDSQSPCDVYISCFPMETRTPAQTLLGFVISTVVMDRTPNQAAMDTLYSSNAKEPSKSIAIDFLNTCDTGLLKIHQLTVCAPDGLQKACSDIVASLDGGVLEQVRAELKLSLLPR